MQFSCCVFYFLDAFLNMLCCICVLDPHKHKDKHKDKEHRQKDHRKDRERDKVKHNNR